MLPNLELIFNFLEIFPSKKSVITIKNRIRDAEILLLLIKRITNNMVKGILNNVRVFNSIFLITSNLLA